ncbi:MAG TPA: helix-hairpin-helix domain-containing protein [Thermoanaerobaculaceae bacterium]|nr:helix-hairpin-helix domain-containing protein [Thermoanaerobaculaceae bacterium]HPS77877.1 helix-hairpin-helix domain-containing protein [Thermoanaerobaculaceae bacterium]
MKMTTRILMTLTLAAILAGESLAAGAAAGQINVNTATAQELQLLPRVGPALAQRIVDFRTENGPFKASEELTRVKGIGEKSFALLQPYVNVQGDTTLKEKVKVPRPKKTAAEKS